MSPCFLGIPSKDLSDSRIEKHGSNVGDLLLCPTGRLYKVGRGCYGFNQLLSPTKTIFKSRLMQLITNSKWICSYVDLTAKSSGPPGQGRAECKIEHKSCWKYEIEQNRAKCKSGRKSLPQRLEPPIRALQVLCFPPLWLPKWPPTLTVLHNFFMK